ncbi:unnamed protein product [Porites lobata]|uniref:G-protein coupled receptors family 1 profile domain-containing protein n=1 Tax=Porites lobata TaxID=104759 RepID=A0ABN8RMQ8_9CNID|nr:unnamed protein product [Porites lobata]
MSLKTHHEKSALIMMGIVIGVFLVCYGMYLRCGFQILSSSRCNDKNYKIPFLALNSAINPLAYAFFKRDIKKERNLRTKTNAFIVSLAVADFCVGLGVIPSMFLCDITNTCHWPLGLMSWVTFVRLLLSNTSVVNLCSLVLDRFIAIVHPLKYITLMTRRRITQVIFFSWVLTVSFNALKVIYYVFYFKTMDVLFIWLNLICFEFLPAVVLILCFVSMIFHVRRHDRSARIVEKQLRFNHHTVSFKTHYEKSAVIMMGLVIGVFLVCYGMYLRCSFLILSSSRCNDENTKFFSWF